MDGGFPLLREQVIAQRLRICCGNAHLGVMGWARIHGISVSGTHAVISGKIPATEKHAAALGYERLRFYSLGGASLFTPDDVGRYVESAARAHGGVEAWADMLGVAAQLVRNVIAGTNEPTEVMLARLHLRAEFRYRRRYVPEEVSPPGGPEAPRLDPVAAVPGDRPDAGGGGARAVPGPDGVQAPHGDGGASGRPLDGAAVAAGAPARAKKPARVKRKKMVGGA